MLNVFAQHPAATTCHVDRALCRPKSTAASHLLWVAAPRPTFRILHQAALHGIPVHVLQLLDSLLIAPHVEVMEAPLPEVLQCILRAGEAEPELLPNT